MYCVITMEIRHRFNLNVLRMPPAGFVTLSVETSKDAVVIG